MPIFPLKYHSHLSIFQRVSPTRAGISGQFSHSVVSDSLWPPWVAACQASLSITNSRRLLKLMSVEVVMPSNHLILYCLLQLLHSIFSSVRVFSNESVLHIMWPDYWSFSFSPSNEYSGLISFRMDWLDFLALQETLKSLLQHWGSKASILWCSVFFRSNSHIHTWLLGKRKLWLDTSLLAE